MKILFVTSTRLGDGVLSTGLLDAALRAHPTAEITIACGRLPSPIFRAVPGVKDVIIIDKQSYARHWLNIFSKCWKTYWDWIIDLRNVPLLRLLRTGRRSLALERDDQVHKVLEVSRIIGGGPHAPKIWLTDSAEETADNLLEDRSHFIAIGPTSAYPPKEWSHARFVGLVERLLGRSGRLEGYGIAVLGAESDRERLYGLIDSLAPFRPLNLMGTTDPLEAAAVLARARVFIGNDSGLMHIAAAVGTPTLGIFGPGNPTVYGPYGPHTDYVFLPILDDPHRKRDAHFAHFGGLTSRIGIEDVHAKTIALLARTETGASPKFLSGAAP